MNRLFSFSAFLTIFFIAYPPAQVPIDGVRKQYTEETDFPEYMNGTVESSPSSFAQHTQGNDSKRTAGSGTLIVERPVDPNSYVLGPGDEICIYLWGAANQIPPVVVNSEGMLLIPSIAMIDLRGLTLAQGKEKIKAALLKVFRKAEITISLSKLRVFRAYITGEVKKPGAYLVTGQTRVSDLVEIAGGFVNEYGCRIRGIDILNDSFPARSADIAQFDHGSVIEKNPCLLQGDRVIVRPRKEIIQIFGKISYPGIYDYVKGDRLGDILKAAGGFSRGADSSKITLTRFLDARDSLKKCSLSVSDTLIEINPDDRILVCGLPDYRLHAQVYLEGEVKWPGVYPIQPDKTKLRDLIEMCGGFTRDADLNYSKVIRLNNRNSNEKMVTWLKSFSTTDLFAIERSYLKSQILEDAGVASLNFSDLKDKAGNFLLQNGDRIVIAKISLAVRVSGAVKFPGLVQYEKGKDYKFYIEKAGGFSSTARRGKVRLLKNDVVILLKPEDAMTINPGDMIWVPESDNREAMRNALNILTILTSTVTIIVSIILITRK
jgi:protein involved in polysaccharide export with SLBB domain